MAGIDLATGLTVYIKPENVYKFVNTMYGASGTSDTGCLTFNATRISRLNGLNKIEINHPMGYSGTNRTLIVNMPWDRDYSYTKSASECVNRVYWADASYVPTKYEISFKAKNSADSTRMWAQDFTSFSEDQMKTKVIDLCTSVVNGDSNSRMTCRSWGYVIKTAIIDNWANSDIEFSCSIMTIPWEGKGGKVLIDTKTPGVGCKNDSNVFSIIEDETYGTGYLIKIKNNVPYIGSFCDKITIMNSFETQQFSYLDHSNSSYYTRQDAWDDTTTVPVVIRPDPTWYSQMAGTKLPLTTTNTINSTYSAFQATKLQIMNNDVWTTNHQLGISTWVPLIKTYNEDCILQNTTDLTINNSQTQFNRNGYYLDSNNNLVTKDDNIVNSGTITYQKLCWASEDYAPNQLAIEDFSSKVNEPVYLGGGIPIAHSTSEKTDNQVKLDYTVQRADGSSITADDGNINIKIELSNKQFENGTVAPGAISLVLFATSVDYTSFEGHMETELFSLGSGEKIWLNAYAIEQGYTVDIKNIDVH